MAQGAGYVRSLLSYMEDIIDLPLFRMSIAIITVAIVIYKYNLVLHLGRACLNSLYQISDDRGNTLHGPSFKWPDGQTVEKFLKGSEMSSVWRIYGHIYRIWTPFRPEVVITTAEDVKEFYSDSHVHTKAPSSNAGWLFSLLLGDCLGLISGDRWTNLRHLIDPFFSHKMSATRTTRVVAAAEEYLNNELPRLARRQEGNDEAVTVNAVYGFSRFPFFFVAEVIYGKLDQRLKNEMWALAEEHTSLFRHIVQGGIHRYRLSGLVGTEASKETFEFVRKWESFNRRLYQSHLAQSQQTPLVQMVQASEAKKVSFSEVIQTIDESLFANLDVTTHVLTWAIVLLADHRETQEAIRQEAKENSTDFISYINSKSTLLHFSVLESLRVRPLLAFTIPESAQVDKILSGFKIPKNTDVVVDVHALHLRNPFWGRDLLQYRPQRFRDITSSEMRYNLATFGFGPRKCLGQHIAETMVKSVLAQLVTNFELRVLQGKGKNGQYSVDGTSWIPLSDVELELRPVKAEPSAT